MRANPNQIKTNKIKERQKECKAKLKTNFGSN